MKKFVSVLSVLMALCLVIGCFAACSNDAEDPPNADDATVADATDAATAVLKVIDIPLTEEEYAELTVYAADEV